MFGRRRNILRARLKSMLVRRRRKKRFKGLKALTLLFLFIFVLPIMLITIITMLDFNSEKNELSKDIKDIYIPNEYLKKAYMEANNEGISFSKLLTYSAFEANFTTDKYNDKVLHRAIKAAKKNEIMNKYQERLNDIYSKVFDEIRVGPIPEKKEVYKWNEKTKKWEEKEIKQYNYTSVNDFGDDRTYGGARKHEGNDLIADMGTPIVSMTDGEITRLGWNEYGGQRIGITSSKGTYFYYAHMDSYAEGMIKGKRIKAGDVIGYIGNTGYGPPGTRGKFTPHLHVQIGYRIGRFAKDYTWFNPYDIIKFLDDYRVNLVEKNI